MRAIFAGIAAALFATAGSADVLPAYPSLDLVCNRPSPEAAALDGLARALARTAETGHEWGGVVYERADGSVCVTPPATSHSPHALLTHFKPPRGGQVLAIYHTHPSRAPAARNFSPHDVATACAHKLPSYVVDLWGRASRLDPGPGLCSPRNRARVNVAGRFLNYLTEVSDEND